VEPEQIFLSETQKPFLAPVRRLKDDLVLLCLPDSVDVARRKKLFQK
jgi:hypothetical protein